MKKNIKPKIIKLIKTKRHFSVLKGPPESVIMCSGLVGLKPGESVGEHSTKDYEELLIILEGSGSVMIKGQKPISKMDSKQLPGKPHPNRITSLIKTRTGYRLKVKPGMVVYNPPQTEHNVINTSKKQLRYIYVVAKTKL